MTAEKIKNPAASVRAKLLNMSRAAGEELQNLLLRFAAERFLYRLSVSEYREKFLLKGAVLFSIWFDEPHRPTKDVDLLGFGAADLPTLQNIFGEICKIEVPDGLDFPAGSLKSEKIREDEIYEGVRFKITAMLEKAKISVQIDVGFGDAVTPPAVEETLPTFLEMPAPRLKVYPKETVIAEKFEAMVKLGIANGRMKDFWDINYLIKECEFKKDLLNQAIQRTFAARRTELPKKLPVALTDEFAANPLILSRWNGFIKRNKLNTDTDFKTVINTLRKFFLTFIKIEK